MSSLERAKQFLAQKATRLALGVVPLAALAVSAVPAQASTIFQTGETCSVVGSGTCSVSQTGAVGGNPQANWVALTGSGTSTSSSGSQILDFDAIGTDAGTLTAGSVPVYWNFTLNPSSGSTVYWTVEETINFSSGGFTEIIVDGNSSAPGQVTGTDSITIFGAIDVTGYEIQLNTNGSTPYTVNIPAGSLDLNPGGVPEPATLILVAGAGALLLLRRKKKA
jgi:hypothetical protein